MHEIWTNVFSDLDDCVIDTVTSKNQENTDIKKQSCLRTVEDDGTSAQNSQTYVKRTYRDRKNPRNYNNWADVKRKRLKNEGKVYLSRQGDTVLAKVMGKPCDCRYKCATKFTLAERTDLFNQFWQLGDREKQWLYITEYTTKQIKKRGVFRDVKRNRKFTYKYYFPSNSAKVNVCRIMFLNTYSISESLIKTAWSKFDGSTSLIKDMRGKHKNHKKIIDDDMIKSVCDHVNTFAPVESHYNESKILYLDNSLNISRMFNLYEEWPELCNYSNRASTIRQYRDIVNKFYEVKRK